MKDKRIWIVIGCILVIGTSVTRYTQFYVVSQATALETTAGMAQETAAAGEDGLSPDTEMQAKAPDLGESMASAAGQGGGIQIPGAQAPRMYGAGTPGGVSDAPMAGMARAEAGEEAAAPEAEAAPSLEEKEYISEAGPSQDEIAEDEAPISPLTGGRIREEKAYLPSDYRKRLEDLDTQIQKMREGEMDSNVYSIKTSAGTELKMWESELNTIYNALLEMLPQEDAAGLAAEQQEWLKSRDARAVESGKGGGSMEGIGYTSTLVSLTRDRAYELAGRYEEANGYVLIEDSDSSDSAEVP